MNTVVDTFEFSPDNWAQAETYIRRYPEGRQASAVLALLDLAQRQSGGWLPRAAIERVAEILQMAPIRVYEVATFYEMFNLEPVGEHVVRVCTTTPCMLQGATEVLAACKDELQVEVRGTTDDGKFTLQEFECLGACVNAPIVWIDDDFYEDLDGAAIRDILKRLRIGELPEPGSAKGRLTSAPASGPKTLTTDGTEG